MTKGGKGEQAPLDGSHYSGKYIYSISILRFLHLDFIEVYNLKS